LFVGARLAIARIRPGGVQYWKINAREQARDHRAA
jgi:hypothetical protein